MTDTENGTKPMTTATARVADRREWILDILRDKSSSARELAWRYFRQSDVSLAPRIFSADLRKLVREDKIIQDYNLRGHYRLRDDYRKQRGW